LTIFPTPACHRGPEDTRDKRGVLYADFADADRIAVPSFAEATNINVVISCREPVPAFNPSAMFDEPLML
jgi:hypothetical protein